MKKSFARHLAYLHPPFFAIQSFFKNTLLELKIIDSLLPKFSWDICLPGDMSCNGYGSIPFQQTPYGLVFLIIECSRSVFGIFFGGTL